MLPPTCDELGMAVRCPRARLAAVLAVRRLHVPPRIPWAFSDMVIRALEGRPHLPAAERFHHIVALAPQRRALLHMTNNLLSSFARTQFCPLCDNNFHFQLGALKRNRYTILCLDAHVAGSDNLTGTSTYCRRDDGLAISAHSIKT